MKNLLKILVIGSIIFGFCVVNAGDFYQVSVIKSGQGSGVVKNANLPDYDDYHMNCGNICEQPYSRNETVTLIAEPDNDSFFVGWDGCAESRGNMCIITDLKNKLTDEEKYNGKKITAFFDKKSPTVSLSESAGYTVNKSKWQSIKTFIRKIVGRVYVSLILDSKEHFLSCEELPSADKVKQIMDEHQDILQKIKQVKPGSIFVNRGDYEKCVDKSDIVISYPSHQNRLEIEKIINGKTFFGIPYRLQNQ